MFSNNPKFCQKIKNFNNIVKLLTKLIFNSFFKIDCLLIDIVIII